MKLTAGVHMTYNNSFLETEGEDDGLQKNFEIKTEYNIPGIPNHLEPQIVHSSIAIFTIIVITAFLREIRQIIKIVSED